MKLYGLMAEFEKSERLLQATRAAREAGYIKIDAYTPLPIEGLDEALSVRRTRLPSIVLCGGIIGAVAGYLLQYYTSAIDYPLNVGGRPYLSWPSFIPITFELTILFAALSAAIGMFALNGLPRPYHPVFNVERFTSASRDRFFLCIEASDPRFTSDGTHDFLRSLHPRGIYEVPP